MGESDSEVCFLSLDQGGGSSRAMVFDQSGRQVAIASCAVATRHRGRCVEQDPLALLRSLQSVAAQALAALTAAQRARLHSAALVTQRSSLLCWRRDNLQPLSPVLSWQDTRAQDVLSERAADSEAIYRETGLFPNAHYGASKMHWCLTRLPAVAQAAAQQNLCIGPLASYLAMSLTAEHRFQVDAANAQRSLLYRLGGDWSPALLERFGIARHCLPAICPTVHDYGRLALSDNPVPEGLASRFSPVALRVLNGDQSAAVFANGQPRRDTAYINLGTGAFIYRLLDRPVVSARLLSSIVYRGAREQESVYVQEGTVNGAGSALQWLGEHSGEAITPGHLQGWARQRQAALYFINTVGGLGSPFWRSDIAANFVGTGDIYARLAAVADSVIFLLYHNLLLMQQGLPDQQSVIRQLRVSGGLSQSDDFCQQLADLSGLPLQRDSQCEASARGAAYLAASDCYGERGSGVPAWNSDGAEQFSPRDSAAARARYQDWLQVLMRQLG